MLLSVAANQRGGGLVRVRNSPVDGASEGTRGEDRYARSQTASQGDGCSRGGQCHSSKTAVEDGEVTVMAPSDIQSAAIHVGDQLKTSVRCLCPSWGSFLFPSRKVQKNRNGSVEAARNTG